MIRFMKHFGSFYPTNNLSYVVDKLLDFEQECKPKAIIVPHAGYIYSGLVAGKAYAQLKNTKAENIFIFGPSHYEYIEKPVVSDYDDFETPFGLLPVNKRIVRDLLQKGIVDINNIAHEKEHSIEVQLPFIAKLFNNVKIVPILLNKYDEKLKDYLSSFLERSLFVVSSDLSHYHPAEVAEAIDKKTINNILELKAEELDACGSAGIKLLIEFAKSHNLKPKLLDYLHSGFANKDFSSVVGYASFCFR